MIIFQIIIEIIIDILGQQYVQICASLNYNELNSFNFLHHCRLLHH